MASKLLGIQKGTDTGQAQDPQKVKSTQSLPDGGGLSALNTHDHHHDAEVQLKGISLKMIKDFSYHLAQEKKDQEKRKKQELFNDLIKPSKSNLSLLDLTQINRQDSLSLQNSVEHKLRQLGAIVETPNAPSIFSGNLQLEGGGNTGLIMVTEGGGDGQTPRIQRLHDTME